MTTCIWHCRLRCVHFTPYCACREQSGWLSKLIKRQKAGWMDKHTVGWPTNRAGKQISWEVIHRGTRARLTYLGKPNNNQLYSVRVLVGVYRQSNFYISKVIFQIFDVTLVLHCVDTKGMKGYETFKAEMKWKEMDIKGRKCWGAVSIFTLWCLTHC